ncbi:uncharacterized protein adgrg4a [Onychostoma macrolepis]|uniref:uncharacterized protein adgrg4a n=1 Tax=Onychostoma macrolepis TaxID=369639 RepID=UPI002729CA7F|nr:uncharacterized protein adgrg4a [Onychostoma macrolepis]
MHTFNKYLLVTVYMWILGSSLNCAGSSLWGMKKAFTRSCVWQLNKRAIIPPLEELSLCINLKRNISTSEWTAFDYKGPGQKHMELGLAGNMGNVIASLFGKEWTVAYDMPLKMWHTVCLTWSSHNRLFQVIINKDIFGFHLNETSPRYLAAYGTLSLGVSHDFVGGSIVFETGKNFMGDMSLFRMWGAQMSPQQLDAHRCVDGNIVTWRAQDWDYQKCPPIPDDNFICESSKYKIQMNTAITQNINNDNTENDIQEIVLIWLKHVFPQKISVHSVSLSNLRKVPKSSPQTGAGFAGQNKEEIQGILKSPIKTQWFDCVVFVRVIPAADVSETVSMIQGLLIPDYSYNNILLKTIPASINILSLGTRTSSQTLAMGNICSITSGFISNRGFMRLQQTLGKCHMDVWNLVIKGAPKYITTFQVQVMAPVNVTATERLIFELLTKGYTNATISISVPSGEVNISHISTV